MREKSEKTHYEFLDIPSTARMDEIEAAYRRTKELFSGDSMALYSLYSPEERQDKLKKLEDVYETLNDPVKRKAYDEHIGRMVASPPPGGRGAPIAEEKDAFEEYNETGMFMDRLGLKQRLAIMESSDPMVAERYRILFTRLEQLSLKHSYKTIAVTSAIKGEGKTVTSLNLSWLMATEFGKKVLVIENDLRNPSISSSYLNMGRLSGLIDVIKGDADLRSAINRLEDTSLYFLPARASARNSSVLIDSQGMRSVLDNVKAHFDYVIVDSPPILPLVDMNILSRMVDGLVLVVKAGSTPKDMVKKAVGSLPGKNLMGVVLNGADEIHMKKYYY